MGPIKLKLGSLPKVQTQITPVPGAPPPLQQNNSTRPTATGAQSVAVKSPKAKKPGDTGMMSKSDVPSTGISKLKSFLDTRTNKKNKVSGK